MAWYGCVRYFPFIFCQAAVLDSISYLCTISRKENMMGMYPRETVYGASSALYGAPSVHSYFKDNSGKLRSVVI